MRNPSGESTAGCCVNESRALQARGDGKQIPGSKQDGISGKVFHFSVKLLSYCFGAGNSEEKHQPERPGKVSESWLFRQEGLCTSGQSGTSDQDGTIQAR